MTDDQRALQASIRAELGITDHFDAQKEIERRVRFLSDYLLRTGCRSLVLGISGGVDSLAAGCLSQRAVEQAREQGHQAQFIAVRLPYGEQADEKDAQGGLKVINPDQILVVNVKPASDAMLEQLLASGLKFRDAAQQDFLMGNIKARQRMVAQYAIAGANGGLVVGTDHAAEALMGFFTKFDDLDNAQSSFDIALGWFGAHAQGATGNARLCAEAWKVLMMICVASSSMALPSRKSSIWS